MLRNLFKAGRAAYRFFVSERNTQISRSLVLLLIAALLILNFVDDLMGRPAPRVTLPWSHVG